MALPSPPPSRSTPVGGPVQLPPQPLLVDRSNYPPPPPPQPLLVAQSDFLRYWRLCWTKAHTLGMRKFGCSIPVNRLAAFTKRVGKAIVISRHVLHWIVQLFGKQHNGILEVRIMKFARYCSNNNIGGSFHSEPESERSEYGGRLFCTCMVMLFVRLGTPTGFNLGRDC